MVEDLTEEFRSKLLEGLHPLQTSLIVALKQIIDHPYPPEVFAVAFEVFPDTWSRGFPARAFFLDGSNNEHFIYVNGEATYPSPIDPGILDVPHIITSEYENSILDRDPTLDTFSVGADEFIAWFAVCWAKAGGTKFPLHATIADHDSERELNLRSGQWQDRYAAF
jgi:hypothetical protein